MGQFILGDKVIQDKADPKILLTNDDFNKVTDTESLRESLLQHGRDVSKIDFNISYEEHRANAPINS